VPLTFNYMLHEFGKRYRVCVGVEKECVYRECVYRVCVYRECVYRESVCVYYMLHEFGKRYSERVCV